VFILPWAVGISVFFLYACARSIQYALSDVRLTNGLSITYQGFANFVNIFTTDNTFPVALMSFATGLILRVPIIVAFALIMALLLNSKIRARALFRVVFFLPVIIATGPVMDELTRQGVASVPMVNQATIGALLGTLPQWIGEPIQELFSSLILILWYSGVQILIFIAGLQKVPKDVYEAARIDGASAWESFWKVTLPTVKPMILLNAVYTIVALATSGQNEIITMIYDNMFNSAVRRGYGYAAAMAWAYALVVSAALAVAFLLLRDKSDRKVVYEQRRIVMKGGYYNDGKQ
jgi:ABC-type sugar transport system permease subunit